MPLHFVVGSSLAPLTKALCSTNSRHAARGAFFVAFLAQRPASAAIRHDGLNVDGVFLTAPCRLAAGAARLKRAGIVARVPTLMLILRHRVVLATRPSVMRDHSIPTLLAAQQYRRRALSTRTALLSRSKCNAHTQCDQRRNCPIVP